MKRKRKKKVYTTLPNKVPTTYSQNLEPDILDYIRAHYQIQKRSKVAKQVGLPKMIFNQVCLELGLGS